jgi:succinate dehydrogenase / fumarate reductase flavoprotein subunit
MKLDARVPAGPITEKWDRHKFEMKLVNPANNGDSRSSSSAPAWRARRRRRRWRARLQRPELCIQDSPRRAHSIAAQGGINAAKNYQNDGDSVPPLLRHGEGRRLPVAQANVYRPPAERQHHRPVRRAGRPVRALRRPAGQPIVWRRQVSRTFYARQTGQQLLIGAYQSLMRQVHQKAVKLFPRRRCWTRRDRRQGARDRRAQPGHRRDRALRRRCRHPPPAATAR